MGEARLWLCPLKPLVESSSLSTLINPPHSWGLFILIQTPGAMVLTDRGFATGVNTTPEIAQFSLGDKNDRTSCG
jgi:hypothetical protein